jgi:hypothetical protein
VTSDTLTTKKQIYPRHYLLFDNAVTCWIHAFGPKKWMILYSYFLIVQIALLFDKGKQYTENEKSKRITKFANSRHHVSVKYIKPFRKLNASLHFSTVQCKFNQTQLTLLFL